MVCGAVCNICSNLNRKGITHLDVVEEMILLVKRRIVKLKMANANLNGARFI